MGMGAMDMSMGANQMNLGAMQMDTGMGMNAMGGFGMGPFY